MGKEGLEYEADPRHRLEVIKYCGFEEGSRSLTVNGEKDIKEGEEDEEELGKEEANLFRGLAARLNFMSLDGPDLQFPTKDQAQKRIVEED